MNPRDREREARRGKCESGESTDSDEELTDSDEESTDAEEDANTDEEVEVTNRGDNERGEEDPGKGDELRHCRDGEVEKQTILNIWVA